MNCRCLSLLLAALLATSIGAGRLLAAGPRSETKEQRDARMKWWREARFGMFIHWGVYSVPAGTYNGKQYIGAGEWLMHDAKIPVAEYKKFPAQFNPVKFNADEWVQLAKDAGQKYIVITAKHHDGFAMYHSKVHPFNIHDATPFKRDPLKELSEACQKHGIKLGLYYSQAMDWTTPGAPGWDHYWDKSKEGHWDKAQDGDMDKYLDEKSVPQVREILSNYGPIAVLWWDTSVDMTKARAEKFLPLLALQPGIITNDRLIEPMYMGGRQVGDLITPEQFIPGKRQDGDWETCMTINGTWGYKAHDTNWKSTETLLRNLIDIASKGGNYLLNVGPTSEGLIPEASQVRLREIGKWLKVNGESIYATDASPLKYVPEWGRVTQKPGRLYLHVFTWPKDGKLVVTGLANKVNKAWLLSAEGYPAIEVSQDGGNVTVALPEKAPDPRASVVVLEYSGELK